MERMFRGEKLKNHSRKVRMTNYVQTLLDLNTWRIQEMCRRSKGGMKDFSVVICKFDGRNSYIRCVKFSVPLGKIKKSWSERGRD